MLHSKPIISSCNTLYSFPITFKMTVSLLSSGKATASASSPEEAPKSFCARVRCRHSLHSKFLFFACPQQPWVIVHPDPLPRKTWPDKSLFSLQGAPKTSAPLGRLPWLWPTSRVSHCVFWSWSIAHAHLLEKSWTTTVLISVCIPLGLDHEIFLCLFCFVFVLSFCHFLGRCLGIWRFPG